MDRYSVIVLLVLLLTSAAGCQLGPAVTNTVAVKQGATPTHTPTPSSLAEGTVSVRAADGMEMIYVPAGEFLMGSADRDIDAAVRMCNKSGGECVWESFENEYPQHTVYLDAFWIDKTEVTNARYTQCVAAGACSGIRICGPQRIQRGSTAGGGRELVGCSGLLRVGRGPAADRSGMGKGGPWHGRAHVPLGR